MDTDKPELAGAGPTEESGGQQHWQKQDGAPSAKRMTKDQTWDLWQTLSSQNILKKGVSGMGSRGGTRDARIQLCIVTFSKLSSFLNPTGPISWGYCEE